MASETLQLAETESGGGEAVKVSEVAGHCFTESRVCVKDYLGTKSFPRTTDVTNSLEYSMASSLDKHNRATLLDYVNST